MEEFAAIFKDPDDELVPNRNVKCPWRWGWSERRKRCVFKDEKNCDAGEIKKFGRCIKSSEWKESTELVCPYGWVGTENKKSCREMTREEKKNFFTYGDQK